jgi:hypothetical protein
MSNISRGSNSKVSSTRHIARSKSGVGALVRAPRLDATNLAGFTSLMNSQHLRKNIDLVDIEKRVMGKTSSRRSEAATESADPVKLYTQELNKLAGELGIDFADEEVAPLPSSKSSRPSNPIQGKDIEDILGDLDLASVKSKYITSDKSDSSSTRSDSSSLSGSASSNSSDSLSSEKDSSAGSENDSRQLSARGDCRRKERHSFKKRNTEHDSRILTKTGRRLGIDSDDIRRHAARRASLGRVPSGDGRQSSSGPPRLARLTEEQDRRGHINAVIGDMRHETRTSFGVEFERTTDVKSSKLEQIGQLRMTLEEEGINCDAVGTPTMDSPVEEIDSVLSILKLKNDRNRYSSLAEEIILGVAEGVETVLDGTRAIPVMGWKPDYTGYHNTVNVKLHRMRFETSQVVGNVIEKFNVGPNARIFMELLPSFFLYPRQQRKQRGAPGLHALAGPQVGDARDAFSTIRRADVDRREMLDVSSI